MKRVLYIFDFDDTLIKSDAKVLIQHHDGSSSKISSADYSLYVEKKGDIFDFSDFEIYPPNPRVIEYTFAILMRLVSRMTDDVYIITSRSESEPVRKCLADFGICGIPIYAVNSSDPSIKANLVRKIIEGGSYDKVHVFEDNIKNIRSIEKVARRKKMDFEYTLVNERGRPPGAGIIVLKKIEGEFKVLGLSTDSWFDMPKGKIENGEGTFEAALRETREESGITEIDFPLGMLTLKARNVVLFLGITKQVPQILPNPDTGRKEHHGYTWLTWEEAKTLTKPYMRQSMADAERLVSNIF